MAIQFDCPECGKTTKAPDEMAGHQAKCPACLRVITVPRFGSVMDLQSKRDENDKPSYERIEEPAREIRRPCPACGEMIVVTAAVCRFCGEVFDRREHQRLIGSKVHRQFNSQMNALGGLWIFFGCLGLLAAVLIMSTANLGRQGVNRELVGIIAAVMFFVTAIWMAAGIGTCMKQIWAVYLGLVLSYISVIGNILGIVSGGGAAKNGPQICGTVFGILILIVGILQAHRVIGFYSQMRRG